MEEWEDGWRALFDSIGTLTDDDLSKTVSIRGTELRVHEALHRSLAHTSYHVGQIVFVSKTLRGNAWDYLSIPPGGTEEYNRAPGFEKAAAHARELKRRSGNDAPGNEI